MGEFGSCNAAKPKYIHAIYKYGLCVTIFETGLLSQDLEMGNRFKGCYMTCIYIQLLKK